MTAGPPRWSCEIGPARSPDPSAGIIVSPPPLPARATMSRASPLERIKARLPRHQPAVIAAARLLTGQAPDIRACHIRPAPRPRHPSPNVSTELAAEPDSNDRHQAPPAQTPHTGRTPLAQSPACTHGPCAPRMIAACAAGLAGCRPTRSANHFLTSPPQPGAEVRKQLHRTAPTQARSKSKKQDQGKGQGEKHRGTYRADDRERCKHKHTTYPP